MRLDAAFACVLALCGVAHAADVVPGTYVAKAGYGTLEIAPPAAQGMPFSIETISPRGNICSVEGMVRGGVARAAGQDDAARCEIRLVAHADGIEAKSLREECQQYCGANAFLDRMYYRPAPGCDAAGLKDTRSAFQALYDRREYRKALALLEAVPARCGKTLRFAQEADIRNDIAVTLHHLGRSCATVLAPVLDFIGAPEDDLVNAGPFERVEWETVAKATWFNAHLCARPR